MAFTDFFIRRPVLTTALALLIVLVGLSALLDLPLRQYPRIESAVVTVTTEYPGASADLMQGSSPPPWRRRWRPRRAWST
ncbi:efflux RND transporter permease subunit [Stenotrophomonas rhizophila]